MDLHLLFHNIGFVSLSVVGLGLSIFILLNNSRSIVNVTFSLAMLSLAVYALSHVIGVNVSDHGLSREILMFNLAIPFIGIFNAHAVFAILGNGRKISPAIIFMYVMAVLFVIISVASPDLFLLPSVPKMYFPNYYNPGPLNFVRLLLLFGIAVPYMVVKLAQACRRETNADRRKQLSYFLWAIVIGYSIGFLPNLLVYNIPVDPLWGIFTGIFAAPLLYGVVKYELFSVKIIAKQAFAYSLSIGLIGGFIAMIDYVNRSLNQANSSFPIWVGPLASAAVVVTVAVFVWRKLREEDVMKYEFVTVVTHKFRTPLTQIKWAAENLTDAVSDAALRTQIDYIREADSKLVGLTDALVNISEPDAAGYQYREAEVNLSSLAEASINNLKDAFESRNITLVKDISLGLNVICDESRVKFAAQVLLENAIHYSEPNGKIQVAVTRGNGDMAVFSVKDSGIGIPKEELQLLFGKFYRGARARSAYTEGMGIGLYMAKRIISHYHGRIRAESEGPGKGSTFSFSLPLNTG
ncbi:hypothetical protein KGQ27_00905 [Patescibacteria group bacterium]|nr:hypothetical protein [Patescibacteria group bacterium]MDE1946596.1 hypothetical protein [Patescibacteria group bacterium]MDE2010841.1 hypothetical protein [Patescibacteria group bacterium]MDE2233223.1 hypothetical protein [Patescibacteria group bacterium]